MMTRIKCTLHLINVQREGVQSRHEPREMTSGASDSQKDLQAPKNNLSASRYVSKSSILISNKKIGL